MEVDSGIISSLHSYCHHQIVLTKFDLQTHYFPPYKREVWHYEDADTNLIRRAINEISQERALINLHIKAAVFNRTVLTLVLLRGLVDTSVFVYIF